MLERLLQSEDGQLHSNLSKVKNTPHASRLSVAACEVLCWRKRRAEQLQKEEVHSVDFLYVNLLQQFES